MAVSEVASVSGGLSIATAGGPALLGRAPGRLAKPEVALELGSCSCRRLLHDLDLLGGEAVEVVDELVNPAVHGHDLPPGQGVGQGTSPDL